MWTIGLVATALLGAGTPPLFCETLFKQTAPTGESLIIAARAKDRLVVAEEVAAIQDLYEAMQRFIAETRAAYGMTNEGDLDLRVYRFRDPDDPKAHQEEIQTMLKIAAHQLAGVLVRHPSIKSGLVSRPGELRFERREKSLAVFYQHTVGTSYPFIGVGFQYVRCTAEEICLQAQIGEPHAHEDVIVCSQSPGAWWKSSEDWMVEVPLE